MRVSPDGAHLLVSSRVVGGEGVVSALRLAPDGAIVSPAAPEGWIGAAPSLGATPRDFALLPCGGGGGGGGGDVCYAAIVANQDSDTLVVVPSRQLCEARGVASPPADLAAGVPTPVCVCFAPG